VQLAPPALEQGVVDRVAHQGVREEPGRAAALLLVPPQQQLRRQAPERGVRPFGRLVRPGAPGLALEALAEHGRGLQRRLVARVQAVQPRLHQALHGARHARAGAAAASSAAWQ
jgi:hypothetical protein